MDTNEKVWTILIFIMIFIGLSTVAAFYYLYYFFNGYLEINSFISFILMFISFPILSSLIFIPFKIQEYFKTKK